MSIEAMKQALEALVTARDCIALASYAKNRLQEPPNLTSHIEATDESITALRQAIRQAQKQEPVARTVAGKVSDWSKDFSAYKTRHYIQPVYTSPPQRQPRTLEQQQAAKEGERNAAEEDYFRTFPAYNNCVYRTLWRHGFDYGWRRSMELRASSPQRLPLTDEELNRIYRASCTTNENGDKYPNWVCVARAVEAAHGIKD